ncbi:MAG: regulatory protein RecX [Gammaproteobacteria bacterium]
MTSALTEAVSTSRETAPAIDVPVLRRAAMDVLARREHSFYELQQKLGKKFPDTDPALINEVLKQLGQENLQSDARFAESYVRYRKSRGFGYHHIRIDLATRRVAEELINQVLFEDDEDWRAMAVTLTANRTDPESPLLFGSKAHRRLLRFLESRGFPRSVIRQTLDDVLKDQGQSAA